MIFYGTVPSVVDPDPYPHPDWIQIQWGPWIRIRIHNPDPDTGGQKWPGNSKTNFIF
jgi:hypothetical protein